MSLRSSIPAFIKSFYRKQAAHENYRRAKSSIEIHEKQYAQMSQLSFDQASDMDELFDSKQTAEDAVEEFTAEMESHAEEIRSSLRNLPGKTVKYADAQNSDSWLFGLDESKKLKVDSSAFNPSR